MEARRKVGTDFKIRANAQVARKAVTVFNKTNKRSTIQFLNANRLLK
jgi:hypothetical protein